MALNKISASDLILTGDFNIAPLREDIGMNDDGVKRWLREGHTAFLPEEIETFLIIFHHSLTMKKNFYKQIS